jgi:hypothetical protein
LNFGRTHQAINFKLPCGKWLKAGENSGEAVGGPLGFWFLAAKLAARADCRNVPEKHVHIGGLVSEKQTGV